MNSTHMIVCKYEEYPLTKLEIEEKNTGFIFFETRGQKFNVGDTCYFMYKDLPDGTSRVILKGVVAKTDYGKKESEEYICDKYNPKYILDKSRKPGMLINQYRLVAFDDKEKFNDVNLQENYGFNTFSQQTHMYLWEDYRTLYDDLKSNVNEKHKNPLGKINKYFMTYLECALKDFAFPVDNSDKRKKRQHISFTSGHSLMKFFYDHHLIQNKVLEKSGCINYIRDNSINLIRLCPICHAQIHNGTRDVVLEMFDYLYEFRKECIEKTYGEYAQKNGYESVEKWMHEYYSMNKYDL